MSALNVPPVTSRQAIGMANESFLQRAILSGRARPRVYSGTNWAVTPDAVVAGATVSAGIGFFVYPGKRFFLTGLTLSADGACLVQLDQTPDNSAWSTWLGVASSGMAYFATLSAVFGSGGGSVPIDVPAGYVIGENSGITLKYKSPTTAGKNVAYLASGYEVDDETHVDGTETIAVFGDSTAWGGPNMGNDADARAYLGNWHWSRVFVDAARAAGVDAQIVCNMAEDGRTMLEGYYNLASGKYFHNAKTWFVSYGMNDAVTSKFPTEAKFKEAAKGWIDRRDRLYPDKDVRVVFLAPSSCDETSRTTNLPTIRTWISDVANNVSYGGTANNVFYVDQSQAWALNATPASDTNIKATERVAGSRVHPSGIGSTAIGAYLWDELKTPLFDVA
jgi:lysophospholipase L1-like esterase